MYQEENLNNSKKILLWTQFFSANWSDHFTRNNGDVIETKNHKKCQFSMNRSILDEADAIIFHGRDLHYGDLPQTRHQWQRWVLYLLESPMNLDSNNADLEMLKVERRYFNWTMGYHRSASIHAPYSKIRTQPENDKTFFDERIKNWSKTFAARKMDAVWFVSNC